MSSAAYDEVAALLADRIGLRLDSSFMGRVARAVADASEDGGLTVASYVRSLRADDDALQELLNRVTVQETSFFRDPGQFVALAAQVLPELVAAGGPVRIWSAGCANGQEPYSLAMTLAEHGVEHFEIVATDVSTDALARTRAGRYRTQELRGLSEQRRERHLTEVADAPGTWEIVPAIRQRVKVQRHNLVTDEPPVAPGYFHVVFCRNVLIYFDRANIVRLLDLIAQWLSGGGHLFLGYSESLWDVSEAFELVRMGDAFAYRVAGPGPARGSVPAQGPAPVTATTSRARARPARPAPVEVSTPAARLPAAPTEGAASPPAAAPTAQDARANGEAALARGDLHTAIEAFRQAVFLDPDDPVAFLNLGLALDAVGDVVAARRAYAGGRGALERCDPARVEAALGGYRFDELARLLDERADQADRQGGR